MKIIFQQSLQLIFCKSPLHRIGCMGRHVCCSAYNRKRWKTKWNCYTHTNRFAQHRLSVTHLELHTHSSITHLTLRLGLSPCTSYAHQLLKLFTICSSDWRRTYQTAKSLPISTNDLRIRISGSLELRILPIQRSIFGVVHFLFGHYRIRI